MLFSPQFCNLPDSILKAQPEVESDFYPLVFNHCFAPMTFCSGWITFGTMYWPTISSRTRR